MDNEMLDFLRQIVSVADRIAVASERQAVAVETYMEAAVRAHEASERASVAAMLSQQEGARSHAAARRAREVETQLLEHRLTIHEALDAVTNEKAT